MPQFASLDLVKSWLNISTTTDDAFLSGLINQISLAILEFVQRPDFMRTTYTELQSGSGTNRLMLRNWPVVSISSVQVLSQVIPAASSFGQSGYTLEQWDGTSSGKPQLITVNGYCFTRAWNNIQVVYQAGYCVIDEAQTIPSGSPYTITPNQSYGMWSQDDGVKKAITGVALTKVSGTPFAGQYSVSGGVYTFNAADNSTALLISYSYVPSPITEACMEWVGERYRYRNRIGETTKSIGGQQTAGYSLTFPAHIEQMLLPYKKYLPL